MYSKILVPIDGSLTSRQGLQEAIALARLTGGRLRLMHVVDDMSLALSVDASAAYAVDWVASLRETGECLLAEALAIVTAAGVEADTLLRDNLASTVHEQIVAQALDWPAELIVLGTHGRRGVGRLMLGSSAESVLRRSPVPVLLVRAPETPEKPVAQHRQRSAKSPQAAPPDVMPQATGSSPLHARLPSAALAIE